MGSQNQAAERLCWRGGFCPRAHRTGPNWTKGRRGHRRGRALLMISVPREPMNMVMTTGNKADGILIGTEGKYSSMAASFR